MSSIGMEVQDNTVKLIGELSFRSVPDIQKRLIKLLPSQPLWTVDLAGVTFSDSSGLALLADCVRMSKKYQFNIGFKSMPKQMAAMAKVTGIEQILGLGEKDG